MSYEFSGKLVEKTDAVQITERFRKREFIVLKEDTRGGSSYPDYVKFQLTQDRCDLLDGFNTGDEIKVAFNIKGNKNERDGKVSYFTNLEAWRIDTLSKAGQSDQNSAQEPYSASTLAQNDESDDLPF
jgi:hypothetical protein